MKLTDGLTFDDVLLVPQFSDIQSRTQVDISTQIGSIELKVPIISANMDTITDDIMAMTMAVNGGLGILHRYVTAENMVQWLKNIKLLNHVAVPSVGVQANDLVNAEKYREFTNSICVDIAHGDSVSMCATVAGLHQMGYQNIIAGNIVTADAAERLVQAGANILKVGVGPGSVCTTRIVTGHGYPQLSAIEEVAKVTNAWIIADGGIRSSGDIVKALAVGADAVMVGGLFAGCHETPNKGTYRGMASAEAQVDFKGKVSNNAAEGVAIAVDPKGYVGDVINELVGGIRSGFSYSGARTLKEFRSKAKFVKMTGNGLTESHPHALNK
jgi:IMP dehydrogenase